jgi:hypothetical protein
MNRLFSSLVLFALLVAGCDRAAPNPAVGTNAPPASSAAPAPKIDFVHPTTPDELVATLTSAFNAGDKEAIERMTLWGDASEAQKTASRLWFTDRAGQNRILEIRILPPDHEDVSKVQDGSGRSFALPLGAEVLNIKHGTDSSRITISHRFGEKEGKYYIAPGY